MLRLSRIVVGSFISALIIAVGWAQQAAVQSPPRPLEPWSSISPGSLGANLTPIDDIKLSSRAAGIVERIHLSDGSPVKKQDPILSLDSQTEAAELAQSEAVLRGAEAEYERAFKEYSRISELHRENANMVPPKDLEAITAQERVTKSRRDQAQAAVDLARIKLENRTVRSPIDGIFLKTNKAVGESVERFETIARVVNPAVLQLHLYCDTSYLGRFVTGQNVQVQVQNPQRANPKVTGTIRYIDNLVDATSSTFRIIVDVTPSDDAIAGLYAALVLGDRTPIAKK